MANVIEAVFFDLDETVLDRSSSLKAFATWQAQGMLKNSVSDAELFCNRFVELDSNGKVWKDKVYAQLIAGQPNTNQHYYKSASA